MQITLFYNKEAPGETERKKIMEAHPVGKI